MITPEQLRNRAMCVYLATEGAVAEDIASHLRQAADQIEDYETELAALKTRLQEAERLLRRCQIALGKMRYVDKYHLFYGDEDSVESIENDLRTFLAAPDPEKEKP